MPPSRAAVLFAGLVLSLGIPIGPAGAAMRNADPAAVSGATVKPPAASFDFDRDPPRGAVSCGKRATVRASARCNGRPATVIGGCSSRGQKRRTLCQ